MFFEHLFTYTIHHNQHRDADRTTKVFLDFLNQMSSNYLQNLVNHLMQASQQDFIVLQCSVHHLVDEPIYILTHLNDNFRSTVNCLTNVYRSLDAEKS